MWIQFKNKYNVIAMVNTNNVKMIQFFENRIQIDYGNIELSINRSLNDNFDDICTKLLNMSN